MRHGQGKFEHADGHIDEGIWNKGEIVAPTNSVSYDQPFDILIPTGQRDMMVDQATSSLA